MIEDIGQNRGLLDDLIIDIVKMLHVNMINIDKPKVPFIVLFFSVGLISDN